MPGLVGQVFEHANESGSVDGPNPVQMDRAVEAKTPTIRVFRGCRGFQHGGTSSGLVDASAALSRRSMGNSGLAVSRPTNAIRKMSRDGEAAGVARVHRSANIGIGITGGPVRPAGKASAVSASRPAQARTRRGVHAGPGWHNRQGERCRTSASG